MERSMAFFVCDFLIYSGGPEGKGLTDEPNLCFMLYAFCRLYFRKLKNATQTNQGFSILLRLG